jgi:hypothetical protein
MAFAFSITTTSTQVAIEGEEPASIVFTVKNTTGQAVNGRASLAMIPPDGEHGNWLKLKSSELSERRFPVDGVEIFTVEVDAVPPDAPSGDYCFRLDMVATENPDETYEAGPAVVFSIARPEPVEESRPFPWWIVIAAGATLLVAGIVAAVILLNQRPELAVTVEPAGSSVLAGTSARYTLTIKNTGKSAEDVWVYLDAPEGASLTDFDEHCKGGEKRLDCRLGILNRDTAAQLQFTVNVDKTQPSDIHMRAAVSAANLQEEQDCSFDVGVISLKEGLSARILQPSENRLFLTGSNTTFRISIINNLEAAADGVTLRYSLPAGADFDPAAQNRVVGVRSCLTEEASREVTCSIGRLSGGEEAIIEIHMVPKEIGVNQQHVFILTSPGFNEVQAVYDMEKVVPIVVCPSGCAFRTITDAVAAAEDGAIIGIGVGVYKENLTINKNVTLVGERTGGTILDGDLKGRVLDIKKDKKVILRQLIVQNGRAGKGKDGGGILNEGDLSLKDVVVRANSAGSGSDGTDGAAFTTPTSGKEGGNGGGVANKGTLELVNTWVEYNTAGSGGKGGDASVWAARYGRDGGNGGEGGGVYDQNILKIRDVVFLDNCAGIGGAGGRSSGLYGGGAAGSNGTYADIFSINGPIEEGKNTFGSDDNSCKYSSPSEYRYDLDLYFMIFDFPMN